MKYDLGQNCVQRGMPLPSSTKSIPILVTKPARRSSFPAREDWTNGYVAVDAISRSCAREESKAKPTRNSATVNLPMRERACLGSARADGVRMEELIGIDDIRPDVELEP